MKIKSSSPFVSIIIATYNSEKTLENTLISATQQTYQQRELVVIDGGSKDDTLKIIDKYRKHVHYCVSEPDRGIPDALNKGIKASKGEWLYFLNSDDVFYDEQVLKRIFSRSLPEGGMIYGNVRLRSSGILHDGEFDLRKLLQRNICHQAQFYHRDVFDKIGGYNLKYKYLSDYDHTLRIYADPTVPIRYMNEIVAVFDDSGRTSYCFDSAFWKDRRNIFVKRFSHLLSSNEAAKGLEQHLYYTLKNGKIASGLRVLLELIFYTRRISYLKAALDNLALGHP